jgi:hypothetical protein
MRNMIKEAQRHGWAPDSRILLERRAAPGANLQLGPQVGPEGFGTQFGERFPLFPAGYQLAEAVSWYDRSGPRGGTYRGHGCSLFLVLPGDGTRRLAAWCRNWHFACQLGILSREVCEGHRPYTDLPLVLVEEVIS